MTMFLCVGFSISDTDRAGFGPGPHHPLLTSSVARGVPAPIGLKSMQNTTFFVLLRPIFAPIIKIVPPNGIGDQKLRRTCYDMKQTTAVFFLF